MKSAGDILDAHAKAVCHEISRVLDDYAAPARLIEAMRYSLLGGGKRLRPTLVMESAIACGGSGEARSVLAAATAIEFIHTFSLVHDDLPSMDNDDLRRGRPTSHKVFGEAMAILAGDAMTTMAFEILARRAEPSVVGPLVAELAHASGPTGMVGGQVLDIEGEHQSLTLAQLQELHRLKTGALLCSACRLGVIATGATDRLAEITRFGQHLGLAFQIVDDMLDVTSTPQQMGKATNKDASRGKNTYPSLIGLDASKKEADAQVDAAIDALSGLDAQADGLRAIARFVVSRDR